MYAKLEAEAEAGRTIASGRCAYRQDAHRRVFRGRDRRHLARDHENRVGHRLRQAQNAEHAAECGAVAGHFHWLVSDLDPADIIDPLPGFTSRPTMAQYDATLRTNRWPRSGNASMEARRMASSSKIDAGSPVRSDALQEASCRYG